uniref:Metallo-beta-lactamase superfamily protein n=1 Tax=Mycena chlorophos TaxID=658473 RepID=A0ABQ0L9X2_MYCCL|nr:metallo-beta-lactamase superfamily protein [Mycena chlorophos]
MRSILCLLPAALALVPLASASFQQFGIPASHSTVSVKRILVGNLTVHGILPGLFSPNLPGVDSLSLPMYAFLVEHGAQKVMFDLGMRQDVSGLTPAARELFTAGEFVEGIKMDVVAQLKAGGVSMEEIETVIWSHAHFDHTGDMTKFPNSTNLVIGPETNMTIYPADPNSYVQASDFAGRNVTKVDFAKSNLTFNGLKAVDYFGDGSFYLMDTPGHFPGHLTGLARVTPTSFIVLGGDSFHHDGQMRPRPALQAAFPCPAHIRESASHTISTDYFWSPDTRPGLFDVRSRASPLLAISDIPGSFYSDPVQADVSVDKLAAFDADEDFLVLIAHDIDALGTLPYFPEALDGWKAAGVKEGLLWHFLEVGSESFVFRPNVSESVSG